jgi:hypothetical protein
MLAHKFMRMPRTLTSSSSNAFEFEPQVLHATDNSWRINILLFALAYALAGVCWWFIDSNERILSTSIDVVIDATLKAHKSGPS